MPGIFGAVGSGSQGIDPVAVGPALDPVGIAAPVVWTGNNAITSHSCFSESPLKGVCHSAQGYRGWFAGDLPGYQSVPWDLILTGLLDGKKGSLEELNGQFAVALIEEKTGRLWLVSDRRSQQPLYYTLDVGLLLFSTALSAFCRLPHAPAFSPEWLYEILYFNHPVLDTTFLRDVKRMPPASVLTWDPADGHTILDTYASPFFRPGRLVEGYEGLELAHEVFGRAAADCFGEHAHTAVALTAGFDSRAALAYAPPPGETDMLAYTYGIPGSNDLIEGAAVSGRLGVNHLPIPFDAYFEEKLTELIYDTVRLSDGCERILRATLPHVFATLYDQDRTVAVSGVSGDHLFRDHLRGSGNVPSLISREMMHYIQGGDDGLDTALHKQAFGPRHEAFVSHIRERLRAIDERHGDIREPEGYLRYLVYESGPKYFGGEAALAGTRLTYRTPYWDARVVTMAFTVAQGTLGFSERLPVKDRFLECGLQGHLIRCSPHYAGAPVKGASPSVYAQSNRLLYRLERSLRRGPGWLVGLGRNRSRPPLEDWDGWTANILADEIQHLLGPEARLSTFLQPQALNSAINSGDLQWKGKLVTAEILLRLIENGWTKL